MASYNRVVLMGHLGQDPELRHTGNETAVCTLSVATTEYLTRNGEKTEEVTWSRVVCWAKLAENCSKYLAKGRPVLVEGRLNTRSFENKKGEKQYVTEVVASNVQFLAAPGAGSGKGASKPVAGGADNVEIPF